MLIVKQLNPLLGGVGVGNINGNQRNVKNHVGLIQNRDLCSRHLLARHYHISAHIFVPKFF